jgi:prepilin-type N-terminal cleavage/methylation domain-containing protein
VRRKTPGFTLVELVIVVAIVGVIGAYAAMNTYSLGSYSVNSQAQSFARDLRHAQSLAQTWSRTLQVNVVAGANGSYSIQCAATGSFPCNSIPVVDPATTSSFSNALVHDVVLSGPASLTFNAFGNPSAGATYTLDAPGISKTVTVFPVTGLVTVGP